LREGKAYIQGICAEPSASADRPRESWFSEFDGSSRVSRLLILSFGEAR
jgi:hypothetical protein